MQSHLLTIRIDPNVMSYRFVWNVIACRDDRYVQNNIDAPPAAGSITGAGILGLDDSQREFFPQAKWLFLQIVGGEPLEAVEDFEEFKEEFDKYPRKEEIFCYPEVAKSLSVEVKKN